MEQTSPLKPKRKDKTEDEPEMNSTQSEEGPQKKLQRLSGKQDAVEASEELSLNQAYLQKDVTQWLQTAWVKQAPATKEDKTGAQIYGEPFQLCFATRTAGRGQHPISGARDDQ
ncbi:GH14256 [Drosophila grimshawi]|uniref:GH14256 n=1 Tax=Drosophila grimshawi TaxID=7222 RepID=B4JYA1_DROGR|nr:GH14256 [Drosophila grimshawi]